MVYYEQDYQTIADEEGLSNKEGLERVPRIVLIIVLMPIPVLMRVCRNCFRTEMRASGWWAKR